MRSIGPIVYLPVPEARAARPAETFASFGQSQGATDSATIVPPRGRPLRSLPFMAQYLAQEIIGPEDAAPRWAERDNAYRAAAGDPATSLISLQA